MNSDPSTIDSPSAPLDVTMEGRIALEIGTDGTPDTYIYVPAGEAHAWLEHGDWHVQATWHIDPESGGSGSTPFHLRYFPRSHRMELSIASASFKYATDRDPLHAQEDAHGNLVARFATPAHSSTHNGYVIAAGSQFVVHRPR